MANQPNKGPPYPKVKYSDAKFREIIPTLPLFENLKVQYKAKGVWFQMISKRGNFYNCECCGIENVGPTPIVDHLRGKKHRLALHAAERLYHPQYTAPKPTKSPARAPIRDAYIGDEDKATGTNAPKNKPNPPSSAQKPKPGPASAQKPKPENDSAQKSKPEGDSAQKSKPEGAATQSKPTPFQKPGPACSKKPMNTPNNKTSAPAAATATAKASESKASESKVSESQASESKASESKASESKASESKASESKASESKANESESKENPAEKKKNGEQKPEELQTPTKVLEIDSEIVILDDDDDDVLPEKKDPLPSKPEVKNTTPVGQAIPVAATAVPKSQRPQRRNLNMQAAHQIHQIEANKSGTGIPPADRVINPAAIIAQSAEQQNEADKPRYQQNRVIIPSVNKKKELANQQPPAGQQPSFSKKTFTPKVAGTGEGIIGVEYVVKILKVYNDPDPFYECCLCEVVMDGIGMQTHLVGYNHRYKYIEKHFPTCFNQYKDHIGNIQVLGTILDRVAKAIESHHGRELPYECLSGEFRANRHGVMTTVYSFRHASEYSGPSFTNVVDAKEVDELYKNKVMYVAPKPDPKRKPTFDTRNGAPVAKKGRMDRERERERERDRDRERERDRDRERPYLSSGRGNNPRGVEMGGPPSRRPYRPEPEPESTVDDATHKLLVEEFLNHTRGKSRSPTGRRRRQRSRSRSPQRSHRRRSVSPLREGDIWQAYRHLVDRSKNELDLVYKEYRKDPEKHPVYDEEWRKFWKHRKDQLAREGLDHRNYDFQPEWVRYFAVRIEELYDEAVEDIKISSRRRLILPMTNDELQDKKYHVKVVSTVPEEQQEYQQQKGQLSFPEATEKTSVVSVLRLLTALEDYLGSLGPKVVDLLSKALLVEKTNPREINEIILNLENCTILETAMEKLKGVLIAGLLEGPKVRAFNNVITETDKILRIAYKIRQENPQPLVNRPQPVPAPKVPQQDFQQKSFSPQQQNPTAPGGTSSGAAASLLSQIDKKELATKLAAALTAQGKTDFNPEQLQQLIAVYSLIDKKKRDSAAASDKQKMTLSDTLTALLNPSGDKSGDASGNLPLVSSRMGAGAGGGARGGNFSNSNDKFGSLNSSISNFVSMLNRDGPPASGNSNESDSDMWQNLQNIQSSLRLQGNSSNAGGGFGNSSANVGRGFGNNSMGGVGGGVGGVGGGGGNFNRSGFGGQSGNDFNSSQNFNRSGYSGGNNNSANDFEAGFRSGFQGMNNSNPSRLGGNDDMVTGGRGVNDMMDIGGRIGNDMISRGRVGNDMLTGGRAGGPSGSNFASRGNSGTGANNTLGFSRGSFLGGGVGASNSGGGTNSGYNNSFPGLSNFSTSITSGAGTFQRSSLGGMGSGGVSNGSQMGGTNFNRSGNSGQPNFNSVSNFNNQQNKNNSGGGPTFGSAPNQRNMGGNQGVINNNQASRSGAGSNWRNQ